jgi:hypothetical protein
MRIVNRFIGAVVVVMCSSAAYSQTDGHLAGLNKELLDKATINAQSGAVNHSTHFFLGGENLDLTTRQLNVTLAAQLASFPLASSSGGFTFSVNDRGEVTPTSTTFGPSFAERAVTIGRNQINVGYTFQATKYDAFEGVGLDSGGLTFVSRHNDCCPAGVGIPNQPTNFVPEFERDLLLRTLQTSVETKTSAFFANYGVTNRFDIGVAVPIVNVKIDSTVNGMILRTASGADPSQHSFDGLGASTISLSDQGSATGLGDILLRAKYNLYRTQTAAFAAAVDLRLPTGDKDNLLGTGATQAQALLVASGEYEWFSPHVNVGYTFSHGETSTEAGSVELDPASFGTIPASVTLQTNPVGLDVPDEVNYTFGFNVAPHPKVTFGFDVRGRTIRDVPTFEVRSNTYLNAGAGALPSVSYTSENEFSVAALRGNLNTVLGVVGGKINLGGTFLLNVTVLFPMSDAGLKPKPTPVIGFDYVF